MLLHQIKTEHKRKYPKPRVGRGGKRGYSSGRGQKGQKSRSGHRIRPAERDLIIRLPKLHGYKNKPLRDPAQVVSVGDLGRVTGDVINIETLRAARLIRGRGIHAKILDGGSALRAFTVRGVEVSAGAKEKIEKAGGKILVEKK